MAGAGDMTLSLHGGGKAKEGGPAPQPALIVALDCAAPGRLPARYLLGGVHTIEVGRGAERSATARSVDGAHNLELRLPDRWMSSAHARISRSFGRWILEDLGSKNGSIVNGEAAQRVVLGDGDIVELGHTLLVFRAALPIHEGDLATPFLDLDVARPSVPGMITLVPDLAHGMTQLARVAPTQISVMICGASGTGKEVIARTTHELSQRSGPFVAVNCGAIPANLVESELFGHKRGAFSGANEDRPGLVRSADGGTLFLDELGDLPPSSQVALLRVLQEREVMPVGGTRPIQVDIRLVAATHQDLDAMVQNGSFRHDLYARVVGFRLDMPPLADRLDDLGYLIGVLLKRRLGSLENHPGLDPGAARLLFRYHWPLNIRELDNVLHTAAVLAGDEPIAEAHLPPHVREGAPPPAASAPETVAPLSDEDERLKSDLIAKLKEHGGNVSAIARDLGKDRKQIQRWLKRFDLDAASYR